MSEHHHHHRRPNEFSPDPSRMSVQPEDVELKVGRSCYPSYYFAVVFLVG